VLLLAQGSPREAHARGLDVVRRARRQGDVDAVTVAERALGLAALELREVAHAVGHLQRALAAARRAGLRQREGEARASLAGALVQQGRARAALGQLDRAAPTLDGPAAARLELQRATVLHRLDRRDDALRGYQRALGPLRRAGDAEHEATLRSNRSLLHAERRHFDQAEADLARAAELFAGLGQESSVAVTTFNRGWVAALRGDVPAALAWFDETERRFVALDMPLAELPVSRAEALLSVGLAGEARAVAEAAADDLQSAGMAADAADARAVAARAALVAGDLDAATALADQARRALVRQGRGAWAVLAAHTALHARWRAGERTAALLAAARRDAEALAHMGLPVAAHDAALLAGEVALALGRRTEADRHLRACRTARQRGPAAQRARAWYAEARARVADGDRRGAEAALRAGLRIVDEYRDSLGATELRAHASGHGEALAALGLRLAVEDGRPLRCLAWMEAWRAGALRYRPVRPPADPVLADELAELRSVSAAIETAATEGRPTATLARRLTALEASIRRRSHTARGTAGASGPRLVLSLGEVRRALGERALLEVAALDERLVAVVVTAVDARVVDLGPVAPVTAELESLRFLLRRLAGRPARAGGTASGPGGGLAAVADEVAARLDAALLSPLRAELGDRDLVVVPPGALHTVPWAMLPTVRGRAVTVAPSLELWRRAAAGDRPAGDRGASVVLAAGPGLAAAEPEVAALAGRYPGALVLTPGRAAAAAVRRALDGAALAHVAAHGTFRSDNPLFSALYLDDGPLTVYDLEGLAQAPDVLVLSACDSGLSAVRPGDELMGLAAAVFSLGTRTLVASVVPVPDDASHDLMVAFHDELIAGRTPAAALAAAQRGRASAGAGFVCFGAG
jgi:hypothetical protein